MREVEVHVVGYLMCFFCLSCFPLLYGNSTITINKSQLERRILRCTDQICHKLHLVRFSSRPQKFRRKEEKDKRVCIIY